MLRIREVSLLQPHFLNVYFPSFSTFLLDVKIKDCTVFLLAVWSFISLSFSLFVCLFVHQTAQEEVHSKEQKVKLLTASVNSFIAKAPPTAHDALHSELDVLTANYQRLCSRLDGKCKTLEVHCILSFLICYLCSNFNLGVHRKHLCKFYVMLCTFM